MWQIYKRKKDKYFVTPHCEFSDFAVSPLSLYRNFYNRWGTRSHWVWKVPVENLPPHWTVMGKNPKTSKYPNILWFPHILPHSFNSLPLWMQIGDAMEMMILSILGPQLHCEWMLPGYKVALITSVSLFLCHSRACWFCSLVSRWYFPQVVFVGMGISSPVWGNVSDKYGRKVVSSLIFVVFIYNMVIS